ncbi:MAG TPA: MmgE/PrpD family protein, partial [Methylomirabilota bacterium]
MTDYLDRLAGFVAETDLKRLPDAAVRAARLVLLDTLGAIAAGSALAENRRLAGSMVARRSRATATLVGHGGKADPLLATFTNGTAGVALEVDEGSRLGGGHPAIHVVPAALATAEDLGLDGRRLLESLIAGYEVCSRLGSATTARPNVHSHGTWGTIGSAVAVAKLAGLGAPDVRAVINLAASMSPANTWTTALEGVTIRNAYPGRSGLEGILAVELHRAGFTGLADGPSDVYGTILADRFEPARALDGLGGALRIQQTYFKRYACCRYTHPALDALLAMAAREALSADQVERVVVTTIPFGPRMADPAPGSMLAAKFSIPYA